MRFILAAFLLAPSLAASASGAPAIYHYIRSNIDGSEPENVVQFRPARRDIAVYKWVEKCTNAAYVTARMDQGVREGLVYHAGRVGRAGEQVRFGSLVAEPKSGTLFVDLSPQADVRITDRTLRPDAESTG